MTGNKCRRTLACNGPRRTVGVAMLAGVVAAGAPVFAAVVGMPLSGTPPLLPNRLRQDSRVSDVDSGGEYRISRPAGRG
jgi:hypothetical protein